MYESFALCIVEHNRNAPETVAAIPEDFEANLLGKKHLHLYLDKTKTHILTSCLEAADENDVTWFVPEVTVAMTG